MAALIPLVGAIFSVGIGLSLVGLLAAAINLPTTAPTVATLLGLGVAVDYGLFLVARHREQLDHGMDVDESIGRPTATSGAAVVVAGSTVVIAILGLYVSGVPFVGALGLASAIVVAVTMLSALTLVPAFLACRRNRRAGRAGPERARGSRRQAAQTPRTSTARSPAGAGWSATARGRGRSAATVVLLVLAIPLLSLRLGQLDAGTDPDLRQRPPGLRPDRRGLRRRRQRPAHRRGDAAEGVPARPTRRCSDLAQKTLADTDGVAAGGRAVGQLRPARSR